MTDMARRDMNGTGLQLRVLKTEKITVVCHFMHVKLNSRAEGLGTGEQRNQIIESLLRLVRDPNYTILHMITGFTSDDKGHIAASS